MDGLYLLMNICFFGYIAFITLVYGVQSSVSESYYRLPRNMQWLFTVATWGYAIPAMIIGLDLTGNGLVFLSGAGICFVGASPAFHKLGMERTVHMVGAIVGIGAMLAFMAAIGYWYMSVSFVILSLVVVAVKYLRENITWWVEIAAYLVLTVLYHIMLKNQLINLF